MAVGSVVPPPLCGAVTIVVPAVACDTDNKGTVAVEKADNGVAGSVFGGAVLAVRVLVKLGVSTGVTVVKIWLAFSAEARTRRIAW